MGIKSGNIIFPSVFPPMRHNLRLKLPNIIISQVNQRKDAKKSKSFKIWHNSSTHNPRIFVFSVSCKVVSDPCQRV